MYLTNAFRNDGFGAQYQTLIYSVIYADMNGKTFAYTPFTQMQHNYDGDPEFLAKKEKFIGFSTHFPLAQSVMIEQEEKKEKTPSEGKNPTLTILDAGDAVRFFEENIQTTANSKGMQVCRDIFFKDKISPFSFSENNSQTKNKTHIAVHIRRFNSHDNRDDGCRINEKVYLSVMKNLAKRCVGGPASAHFHIYSQSVGVGQEEKFRSQFDELGAENVQFHMDESVEDTFLGMAMSDALILSPSSFSYCAGLLNRNQDQIYYFPFWHPALPQWKVIDSHYELVKASLCVEEVFDDDNNQNNKKFYENSSKREKKITIPEYAKTLNMDVGTSLNAPHSEVWTNADKECFVVAFEPNIYNVQDLRSGKERGRFPYHLEPSKIDKCVRIYECALSSSIGVNGFYCTLEDAGTSSIFKPKHFALRDIIAAPTITLKDFFDRLEWSDRIPYVSTLKIDAQAADYYILVGAGPYLAERVVFIDVETHANNDYEHLDDPYKLKAYLEGQNFVCTKWGVNACFYNKKFEHIKDSIPHIFLDS